ncbi:MAG TPA: hypothetical protein VHF86_11045, partial [Xanthomonadaceae bacterium]|nr:hypothetical protein [Xanthomonadaceae bacterium]
YAERACGLAGLAVPGNRFCGELHRGSRGAFRTRRNLPSANTRSGLTVNLRPRHDTLRGPGGSRLPSSESP